MKKITTAEIKPLREELLKTQNNKCLLCEQHCSPEDAVLDHRHSDGQVRGVLHRFCNTFLGKLENGTSRNRITKSMLRNIFKNFENYVSRETGLLHPTHLTPEEKKARNKKRAAKRAKKPA